MDNLRSFAVSKTYLFHIIMNNNATSHACYVLKATDTYLLNKAREIQQHVIAYGIVV